MSLIQKIDNEVVVSFTPFTDIDGGVFNPDSLSYVWNMTYAKDVLLADNHFLFLEVYVEGILWIIFIFYVWYKLLTLF